MTQLSSALAFIPSANLRNMLTFFRAEGDHVAVRLIQRELHLRQPIVTAPAYIGWTATRGDYDLDDHVAHGATEPDAVAELLEWEADQAADAAEAIAAQAEFAVDLADDR